MPHGLTETLETATIATLVADAAHLLPEQAPLHTFVHHNTLHAFEDLPFEQAVVKAARLFGTEPFQRELAFAAHVRNGRILPGDLVAVVADDLRRQQDPNHKIVDGCTRRDYRELRLRHLFEIPRGAALEWQLHERELRSHCHPQVDTSRRRVLAARADRHYGAHPTRERLPLLLQDLWQTLATAEQPVPADTATPGPRRRDQLLRVTDVDVDERVHPLLIRLTAAFLDQGVASWPMPDREHGFLAAVRKLYGQRLAAPDPWSRGLDAEFRRQEREGWDAEHTVREALQALGFPESAWAEQIRATLLSLRGWAGMMRQFELRPDRAPIEPREAHLLDFLAVQLTLDLFAARHALQQQWGADATWDELAAVTPATPPSPGRELLYEAFVMAQIANVDIEAFSEPGAAARWLLEVRAFDEIERRRLLHLAYERRLYVTVLDGLAAHAQMPMQAPPRPRLQAVFCIDERECSTRRHLEECSPDVQTYGYAGFFGVAMAWQGLGEVQSRPLCPVHITPQHYITERALRPEEEDAWRAARRRRGLTTQALREGSRQLARGGILSTFLGLWSVVPMVGRCLFPRISERLLHRFQDPAHHEPVTRLELERTADDRDAYGRYRGYTPEEMAAVVEDALRTIALTDDFCELVLFVGHGSSSLNNPHEAAHDCGATGGGRGGPNARVFAAMANHQEVRERLRQHGITIPDSTWFVGTYHNTADDSMTYYDEDLMPEQHQPALEQAKQDLAAACALEAHERSRRFESAPHSGDAAAAMRHVEGRAVDLAQPRPEYGHATNAYAIVGRRSRTRGLFLDRRSFLVSYDPNTDPGGQLLARLLGAVVPVGAGINLEYYFSYVDPTGYGCGTKLPHNITGLVGVMDGHQSDLRTGLPWQMVEIHEPVRLLAVIDAEPAVLESILHAHPEMASFIGRGWIHLVAWSPSTGELWRLVDGTLTRYEPESRVLPTVSSSNEFYREDPDHLGCARILSAFGSEVGE